MKALQITRATKLRQIRHAAKMARFEPKKQRARKRLPKKSTHRHGSLRPLAQTQYRGVSHTPFFSKLFLTPVGALRGTHTTEVCGQGHNSPSFFALDRSIARRNDRAGRPSRAEPRRRVSSENERSAIGRFRQKTTRVARSYAVVEGKKGRGVTYLLQ